MNDRDMPDSQKLDMIDAYRRSIDKEKLKISTGTKSENGLLSNYILFSQNNVPVILDMQLKRSETNTEDIRVDLSHVAFKDITAGLVHPEVDAQENQNTVKKILTLVKEQNQK